MGKKMTKLNKKRQKKAPITKEFRDQSIIAESMTGKTTNEIADQFDISRQTVSKALNGEEAKKLLSLGTARLQLLMTKSIDTLEYLMDNKHEFGLAGSAFQSAKTILKSIGVVKETLDISHQFPKPLVIKRRDGSETVLGSENDKEEQ